MNTRKRTRHGKVYDITEAVTHSLFVWAISQATIRIPKDIRSKIQLLLVNLASVPEKKLREVLEDPRFVQLLNWTDQQTGIVHYSRKDWEKEQAQKIREEGGGRGKTPQGARPPASSPTKRLIRRNKAARYPHL